jgi:cell division inhibitor SulA
VLQLHGSGSILILNNLDLMPFSAAKQTARLLGVRGLAKGLARLLREQHDSMLHIEVAWLLAFICAGHEAHMRAAVKQGAAEAVVLRLIAAAKQARALCCD